MGLQSVATLFVAPGLARHALADALRPRAHECLGYCGLGFGRRGADPMGLRFRARFHAHRRVEKPVVRNQPVLKPKELTRIGSAPRTHDSFSWRFAGRRP